jgi:hypothetical protein
VLVERRKRCHTVAEPCEFAEGSRFWAKLRGMGSARIASYGFFRAGSTFVSGFAGSFGDKSPGGFTGGCERGTPEL